LITTRTNPANTAFSYGIAASAFEARGRGNDDETIAESQFPAVLPRLSSALITNFATRRVSYPEYGPDFMTYVHACVNDTTRTACRIPPGQAESAQRGSENEKQLP
jgi:hypothetical protein